MFQISHVVILKVFATTGDKKEGGTHILYDPSISQRGALVCVGRAPRRKSIDDYEVQPVIHNPHALPLFRDQPSRKRQREKILKDPLKSHKPDLPVNGPGFGGRVGTTKGSLLTQYLLKVLCVLYFLLYIFVCLLVFYLLHGWMICMPDLIFIYAVWQKKKKRKKKTRCWFIMVLLSSSYICAFIVFVVTVILSFSL